MTSSNSEDAIREISQVVINMHNDGLSNKEISRNLSALGINKHDAHKIVINIIKAYKNGFDPSCNPSFLDSHPIARELLYFIGGVALVLIGSIILSLLLGLLSAIFKLIGLGGLGVFLVKMGEKAAGMLMGFLGTAASSENKSIGMFIGCWIGSGLYYWWLFS